MTREDERETLRREHVKQARVVREIEDAFVNARMPGSKPVKLKTLVSKAYDAGLHLKIDCKPNKSQLGCNHIWDKVDDRFQRCTHCSILQCYKPGKPKLGLLPEFLRNRRLPPTPKSGNHYAEVLFDPRLKIRRSMVDDTYFQLSVRFPKGWCSTQGFYLMQWDKIIEAVEPMLVTKDPVAIFNEAQRAIYGRCWNDAYKDLL